MMKTGNILAGLCAVLMFFVCSAKIQAIEIQASCREKSGIDAPQDALRYKQHINNLHNRRELIYNALNLSDKQIKEHETIINENTPVYEEKFNNLIKESYTLKALNTANAGKSSVAEQKKTVKNIKSDIDNLYKKENKLFKKSLTREQRSKYSMITKLEKRDYKAVSHQKDYYKSNPKMQPFGNPKPCENSSEK